MDTITQGMRIELPYHFTNTGNADLIIDIVTACKCAEIEWSKTPIPPGGRGEIKVLFDSTTQSKGTLTKVIDIIANTNPIVVEAKFTVTIK